MKANKADNRQGASKEAKFISAFPAMTVIFLKYFFTLTHLIVTGESKEASCMDSMHHVKDIPENLSAVL